VARMGGPLTGSRKELPDTRSSARPLFATAAGMLLAQAADLGLANGVPCRLPDALRQIDAPTVTRYPGTIRMQIRALAGQLGCPMTACRTSSSARRKSPVWANRLPSIAAGQRAVVMSAISRKSPLATDLAGWVSKAARQRNGARIRCLLHDDVVVPAAGAGRAGLAP